MSESFFQTIIDQLPKTSLTTIRRLKQIGIKTYFDLISYYPIRYVNYPLYRSNQLLSIGQTITFQGKIVVVNQINTYKKLTIQKLIIQTGMVQCEAVWYNQPYVTKILKPNQLIFIAGEITRLQPIVTISVHDFQLTEKNNILIHVGRIIPFYSEKNHLSSHLVREKIYYLINHLPEIKDLLPDTIVQYNKLINRRSALKEIHFPSSEISLKQARNRLAFDELFLFQLKHYYLRSQWQKLPVRYQLINESHQQMLINRFIQSLPFKLTVSQNRAYQEIIDNMTETYPMNRFLQGEVGSGKTVVAAIAAYFAYINKLRTIFMAPTEILAEQHYQTMKKLYRSTPIKLRLITGSTKLKKKQLSNQRPLCPIPGIKSPRI